MRRLFSTLSIFLLFITPTARAGTSDTLSGFAWADTVGWISFNCTNVAGECDRSPYGVTIDPATKLFSGYAWSDTAGWVSFDTVANRARLAADNTVIGEATILSLGDGGLLKFFDAKVQDGKLTGWMWNGNSDGSGIGWVQLSNIIVAASVTNHAPDAPTNLTPTGVIAQTGVVIRDIQNIFLPKFEWSAFSDVDGARDSQKAYRLVLTAQDGTVLVDIIAENNGNAFQLNSPSLTFGETYRWTVAVQDSNGVWSPSVTASFSLPQALPVTNFFVPTTPTASATTGQGIQFNDTTVAVGTTMTRWTWDFGDGATLTNKAPGVPQEYIDGEPVGQNAQSPVHTYTKNGTYTVTLTVTDERGYVVAKQTTITVGDAVRQLPVWRRIIPF